MPSADLSRWDFDVDRWLNLVIPPPPWRHIPYPIAHFFGYRRAKGPDLGNLIIAFWAFIGVLLGVGLVELATQHISALQDQSAFIIVGSFGAAAVLEFHAIESPLAQPRNAIFGQLISSIVGVSICRLFLLLPEASFLEHRWIGGAIACASATALMALTKTVHPPAGATALLAVVADDMVQLGWWLVPAVMMGCAIMLVVALGVNNIQRRFPQYWWTPEDLRPFYLRKRGEGQGKEAASRKTSEEKLRTEHLENGGSPQLRGIVCKEEWSDGKELRIVVCPGKVIVPAHFFLADEEILMLEELSNRMR